MPERHLGRQIGKYRVIRLLGDGAFAWVYEAIDRDLEIAVALKILRPEFAADPVSQTRFRREASTAARLRHPNIVVVRDVGTIDGTSFVAMDRLVSSLGQRLQRDNVLPEPTVVKIGIDVAAALAAAHAAGVIHRDIKPDNVLFGANGEAVVADFGLARALGTDASLTKSHQVMGTPQYFSPEQARGLELDGRSDLYSLGVTLYRAATGRLPFQGEDWYAVGRQHIDDPVPPPRELAPTLSAAFEQILLRLLAKEPADRFPTAEALRQALQALNTPLPVKVGARVVPSNITAGPHVALPSLDPPGIAPSADAPETSGAVQAATRSPSRLHSRRVRASTIVGAVVVTAGAIVRLTDPWQLWSREFVDRGAWLPTPSIIRDPLSATRARVDSLASDSAQIAITQDSLFDLPRDSNAARKQSAAAPPPSARPTPTTTVGTTRITVRTAPDASLYVDGKRVGVAAWTGERVNGRDVHLEAKIESAPPGCQTAQREKTIRTNGDGPIAVSLPARNCAPIKLDAKPSDLHLLFTPLDGGVRLAFRADSADGKLLVFGHYRVEASLPRCTTFSDTVSASRQTPDGRVFLYIHLACGLPD